MVPIPAMPSARVSSITNPYVAPVGNKTSRSARSSPTEYVPAGTEMIGAPVSKSEMNHDVSSGHGSKKIVIRTDVISDCALLVVVGAPLGFDDGRRLGEPVAATVGVRLGSPLGGSDTSDDDVGFSEGGKLGSPLGGSDTLGVEVPPTGPKGGVVVGLLGAIVTLNDGSELGVDVDGSELGIAEGICEGIADTEDGCDGFVLKLGDALGVLANGADVVGNEVGSGVGNGVGNGVGAPGPAGDGVGRSVIPSPSNADGGIQKSLLVLSTP